MGAVESLDHCCSDRSDDKTNKKFIGSWKAPQNKTQKIDLNRDCGNGAPICDDPLKDLKLDKAIDSELALVFKEVGHRFPSPIHSQEQLMKLLEGFKRRGYSFPGTAEKLCARVWSINQCSRITILQFRAWFQAEVVVSKNNLHALLSHSRWVSSMLKRMYTESETANDKVEIVHEVVNSLRHYLEEEPISSADVQETLRHVIKKSGKTNYILSGRGKILVKDFGEILVEDFEALVTELLVQLYFEHFSESLYDATPTKKSWSFKSTTTAGSSSSDSDSSGSSKATTTAKATRREGAPVVKQIAKMKQFPGSSACCLPDSESGMDRWRNLSESLPVNAEPLKSKSLSGKALPLGDDNRALARSMKFPVGSKFPVGAVAA